MTDICRCTYLWQLACHCRFHPFSRRESGGIATLFLTSALEGGEGSASRLGRPLPPGKTRYPLYRRLGGPQGRSGQVRKISPPPGFDPGTVQPVGSRYTDYATRPTPVIIQAEYTIPERVRRRLYISKNEIAKLGTS